MQRLARMFMFPPPLASMQVVHHPTVLAAYGEGRQWTFEGDVEVKSKFWGRSIELTPTGLLKLSFHDGDVYTWNKVLSACRIASACRCEICWQNGCRTDTRCMSRLSPASTI
jgi:hypothetical protein